MERKPIPSRMYMSMSMDLGLLASSSSNLPPIPNGVYYGQNEPLDAMNRNIYARNLADVPLRPNMDLRSVPSRTTLYPMLEQRPAYSGQYLDYSPQSYFSPANTMGPPSGFKVDDESRMRNQYFALQHGADQSVYVPSSQSDLYKVEVPVSAQSVAQPFPGLFEKPMYVTEAAPYADKIGREIFNNSTKTQLRDVF